MYGDTDPEDEDDDGFGFEDILPSLSVQSPVSAPPAYNPVFFPPEDDFTLQELVPPSISVPPPVSS